MVKIYQYFKDNWRVLVPLVLLAGSFCLVYFFYNQTSALGEDPGHIVSGDSAGAMSIPNTTFIKAYRLLVFTKINGAWPTKDGGYIISGTTDPNIMMVPPDGFVAKLDKQGNVAWMKFLKTTNAAGAGNRRGDEDVQSIIELKDGGYLMASKVWGFIKSAEWNSDDTELNKIMFTRLDKKGNALWSKSFTAFVEDARNSILETDDSGFLFYASIVDLSPNNRGEDSAVYQDIPFASLKVLKLDKNGNLLWSKNIKNFISRENDSYLTQTLDGGYVLAGNLTEPNAAKEAPYNYDTYPGLAKFDRDFNFQWAKSMEGTPLEMAVAIPKAGGGYELGHTQMRQGAAIIHGIIKTPDNGYLVLGVGPGALSLLTDSQNLPAKPKNSFIGFKFDSVGTIQWVKKMTFGFNEFTVPLTNFSVVSTVDNKLMITGPITWADDDYREKAKAVTDIRNWYAAKYGELEILKEENQKTKASRTDYKKVLAIIKIAQDAFRAGIFTMKTDQEMNPGWAKIINPQRGVKNLVVKPTEDSGAIIAGEYETTVVQSAILSSVTYYQDGFLAKMDASGNVNNNKNWLIDYTGGITTELMTPYSVSNNLTAQAESYMVELASRKPEFSLYKKTKITSFAPFISSKITPNPQIPTVAAYNNPLQNSTSSSVAPRTWPQINYERTATVEPINEKSRTIHSELLPILNQLYNNQVKLKDNLSGQMLSYAFDRMVTADDMTAVKNYLVGLGYKMQDEGTYQLTMYKPGYWLIMSFSINNTNKAFLDVTY